MLWAIVRFIRRSSDGQQLSMDTLHGVIRQRHHASSWHFRALPAWLWHIAGTSAGIQSAQGWSMGPRRERTSPLLRSRAHSSGRDPTATRWSMGGSGEIGGSPERRCSGRTLASGETAIRFAGADPARCREAPQAGGMQRGRASGPPCQDGAVVQHTSCGVP